MAEDHDEEVRASRGKVHHGNNDGYVPHHPEPGHGENPHAKQKVRLWAHAQGEGCYDTSAHADRDCFGEADDFRKMQHAHINSGTHSFHGNRQAGGRLRMSGHPGAHRVGKR